MNRFNFQLVLWNIHANKVCFFSGLNDEKLFSLTYEMNKYATAKEEPNYS